MHSLKLQSAVHKVQPSGTVHVHGSAELALGKRLVGPEIGRRHAPVGERYLNVEDHSRKVGDQNEAYANGPAREREPYKSVTEEGPVARHKGDFNRACPPCGTQLCSARGHEVSPG